MCKSLALLLCLTLIIINHVFKKYPYCQGKSHLLWLTWKNVCDFMTLRHWTRNHTFAHLKGYKIFNKIKLVPSANMCGDCACTDLWGSSIYSSATLWTDVREEFHVNTSWIWVSRLSITWSKISVALNEIFSRLKEVIENENLKTAFYNRLYTISHIKVLQKHNSATLSCIWSKLSLQN